MLLSSQLEIYQAFVEKVLEQTHEDHVDFKPLGQALESLQDLKSVNTHSLRTLPHPSQP